MMINNGISIEEKESILTKQVNLSDLHKKSMDIQSKCKDFIVGSDNLAIDSYESDRSLIILKNDKGYLPYNMTKHSIGQLCQKIGMNLTYYMSCFKEKAFSLLDTNMNYWIDNNNKKLLLRTYKDSVRGVLSNRYSFFDTPNIIENLDIDNKDFIIKGYYLSPFRFHLRFIQNRAFKGDNDLFGGFTIDSSDVGRSSLLISFFIYKQVCSNGLCLPQIGGSCYERRHIGLSYDNFHTSFKSAIDNINIYCEKAEDLINYSKSNKIDLRSMTEDDLERFITYVSRHTSLSNNIVSEKVIPLMKDKYGTTSWGVINAITEVAQEYTLERRLDIERKAGELATFKVA